MGGNCFPSATGGRRRPTSAPPPPGTRLPLLLLLLSALITHILGIRIESIYPEQGGTAGGTRLTIFGSGFSGDHYTGQNAVRLGPHECEVLNYYSTAYMITCVTPAVETDNSFNVQVEAGGLVAQHCCFAYAEWASPEVEGVWPRSAGPGQEVLLWGPHKGMFDSWDAGRVISSVSLGAQYCEVSPEAGEEALWRDGNRFYLRCTLPAMGSFDGEEQSQFGQAGMYNITLEFAPSSDWAGGGYAAMENRIADRSGRPYDLQVHPVVTSMEPHSGSLAGGTAVTLTGAGFPTIAKIADGEVAPSSTANDVDIILPGRSKCNVQLSNSTRLVCMTEATAGTVVSENNDQGGTESSLAAAFRALHPGARGMEYLLWYNQTELDRDWPAQMTWDEQSANESLVLSSEFHAPRHPQDDNFVDAIRTFFVPPVDGPYRFWINSDDSSVLWVAYANIETGETEVKELLSSDYAPYGDWYRKESQRSEEVELRASQPVLLLAARYEKTGYEHLQVGVTMPTSTPRMDATPEVQVVTMSADMHGMQQALRLFYPTPVASVLRVSFSTNNGPETLDNAELVVALTFSPDHRALLPLNAQPGQLGRELSALLRTDVEVEVDCVPAEARASWTITVSSSTQTVAAMMPPTATILSTSSAAATPSPSGTGTAPPDAQPGGENNVSGADESLSASNSTDVSTTEVPSDDEAPDGSQRRLRQEENEESEVKAPTSSPLGWCGTDGSSTGVGDPATVQVVVSTVQEGVGLPSTGYEIFPLAVPELYVTISAAPSEEDMKEAVELLLQELSADQLGGLSLTVTRQPVIEQVSGIQYIIEFPMLPHDAPFTLPQLGIRVAASGSDDDNEAQAPSQTVSSTMTAEAEVIAEQTEVFGGAVQLSAPFTGRSAIIPINSTALQVKTLLQDLAGVACRRVGVQGEASEGEVQWELTLDPLRHFGDTPQMSLDSTGLGGTNARAVVETSQDGSNTWNSRPIAGDFLRQPIPRDDAVQVWVSGALGLCKAENGVGCGWQFSEELTPQVTSVAPLEGEAGTAVTLTGSRFADNVGDNSVRIGGAECRVTSASTTAVECEVQGGGGGVAGIHPVLVTVAGLGLAAHPSDDAPLQFTLRVLALTSVSPTVVVSSESSSTVIEIEGAGFDRLSCANNVVTLSGDEDVGCEVVPPCEATRLRCLARPLSPGPVDLVVAAAGERAVLSGAVEVRSDDGGAPSLRAVEPRELPSAGGALQVLLGGNLQADGVSTVHLLPAPDGPGATDGQGSFSLVDEAAVECVVHADIAELTRVDCSVGRLQSGRYRVMLTTVLGVQLMANDIVTASLSITRLSPASGSMAGGSRVTITGSGFSSEAGENAVWLPVPVSTTFPAGVIPCDVNDASGERIVCTTRPHCSGNARAFLPGSCELQPTEVGEVVVALCNAGLSDTARLRCLFGAGSRPPAPRATCTAPTACAFAYSAASTARVDAVSPAVITSLPSTLTLTGSGLSGECEVEVGGLPCTVTSASTSSLRCAAPDLPAGRHRVQLRAADGSTGWVDAGVGYLASVSALSLTHVSLAGGGSLTLASAGAPFFVSDQLEENSVTIDGLPCNVTRVESGAITCTTPPLMRRLKVDYYNAGDWADEGWAAAPTTPPSPLLSTTVVFEDAAGLALDWGWGQPEEEVPSDRFLAELHGWLLAPESGNYTIAFEEGAEMAARLWLDDAWVAEVTDSGGSVVEMATVSQQEGRRPASASVQLSAGFHSLRLQALESRGRASVALRWSLPSDGTMTTMPLPATALFALRPGRVAVVKAQVAGLDALPSCPSSSVDDLVRYPAASSSSPEATTLDPPLYLLGAINSADRENTALRTEANQCAVLPSTFATPILLQASVLGNGVAEGGAQLRILGYGFDQTQPSLGAVAVTLHPSLSDEGDTSRRATCDNVRVESSSLGSDNDVRSSVTCVLPHLPAGDYLVVLSFFGAGDSVNELPLTYEARITGLSTTRGSMNGGTVVTITGANFASSSNDYVETGSDGEVVGFEGSVRVGNVACEPSSVTSSVIVCTTSCCGGGSSAQWGKARVELARGGGATLDEPNFALHVDYSPTIERVSHDGDSSLGPFRLGVDLRLPAAYDEYDTSGSANEFLARLSSELTVTVNGTSCDEVVVESMSTITTEEEPRTASLVCDMPTSFPGGIYRVRATLAGFGHSDNAILALPVTIAGMSPTESSLAGGLLVTVTGSGFSPNAHEVTVMVGNATAEVVSSNAEGFVFLVPGGLVGTGGEGGQEWEVSVRGSLQADSLLVGTVTTSAAQTAVLSDIHPTRGSSAGGTPVTLTLSDVPPGDEMEAEVLFGGQPGVDVTMTRGEEGTDSATVRCLSPAPLEGTPRLEPVTVEVRLSRSGLASGDVEFSYIDLWSASSTWGGGLPPFEGDSVVVPAGTTIMLDVSPPRLGALILEGALRFDPTVEDLRLDAGYIIVAGGALLAGSEAAPHPGSVTITLHGEPKAVELPVYGAKCVALREGRVALFGRPKRPTWVRLAATVHPGEIRLPLDGPVEGWEVGDEVVVASSSFFAAEVDTARIAGVDVDGAGRAVLTLDQPLRFSHLGEGETVGGRTVSMAAEVAVLSRNVVVQGDAGSARSGYGAQIMMHSPPATEDDPRQRALLQLQDVEVRRAGQAFRLGRYPIHFHMHGDATGSFVRHSTIHTTFNRAITLHGSHNIDVTRNVAYDNAGHAFFLEDGVERGNVLEGNLGLLTRRSHSLLATDTTPATFWVTNPDNILSDNVAAGSEGYGFWYRMLDHPEGASFTLDVCPKYVSLAAFANNTAHSNLIYGLRVFPEYYPNSNPCDPGKGDLVLAAFDGLTAYKNGMKGAIATQVGLVQFRDFAVVDCGGGPFAHKVNGKDHGGGIEFTWIIDGRNRSATEVGEMAGVVGALIVAKSEVTQRQAAQGVGTAAQWPSARGIRGLITQSLPQGTSQSSAFMQATDVTWVGFSPEVGQQFVALEACGKCKNFQGGQHTFIRGASFLGTADGGGGGGLTRRALARWSWPHQGIFLDVDGTLLGVAPGSTLHAGSNGLLEAEPLCSTGDTDNGIVCSPELTFRRTMLNGHSPMVLSFRDLLVSSADGSATSRVQFTKYNDNGYQWTVPIGRDYYLHWDAPERVDPDGFTLHEMEEMGWDDWLLYHTRHLKMWNHWKVNEEASDTEAPLPADPRGLPHGASAYERLMRANPLDGGREDTTHTIYVAGTRNSRLRVKASVCPPEGCPEGGLIPEPEADYRQGKLLWSAESTWTDAGMEVPLADGDDVVIPEGWDVVLDTSTPRLNRVTIAGNLTFGRADLELHAVAVVVAWGGRLQVGTEEEPHRFSARIVLHGAKDSPPLAVNDDLVPGAKVLAAFQGGSIEMHGAPHGRRWTRLAKTAEAGTATLELLEPVDWVPGNRVIISSTSYNPDQAEVGVIEDVLAGGTVLVLSSELSHEHAVLPSTGWEGGPQLGAEVGLLDSTVVVESGDGERQQMAPDASDPLQGQKFGAYVLAHGDDTAVKISEVTLRDCGQYGVSDGNSCVRVMAGQLREGSYLRSSVIWDAMASGLRVEAGSSGLEVVGNVVAGSYDSHGMHFGSGGSTVSGNLVMGTTKVMEGKSSFDKDLPASFSVTATGNRLVGNVAAGSHRIGFHVVGAPLTMSECRNGHSDAAAAVFAENMAHSSLVGLLLVEGGGECTGALRFAAWRNWDFGVLAGLEGIRGSVLLEGGAAVDNRHAGVLILIRGANTDEHEANILGGLIQGQSGGKGVCGPCPSFLEGGDADSGCHPRLARTSYTHGPTFGLVSATFATRFTSGPEQKPWDGLMGYPTVLGRAVVKGVTFADFYGDDGCGDGSHAITNHPLAPDAFHPHDFSDTTLQRVAVGAGGLLKLQPADPEWRHPSDCGEAAFVSPDDGAVIQLNCDGPMHVLMKDLDGSLFGWMGLGGRSTVVGVAPVAAAARPTYAQGTPIADGPCPFINDPVATPGYTCVPGWSSVAAGTVVPADGLWGDPQLLVIESRDKDSEDRNFGPVLLESGGAVDLLTPCMDHGWCFGYTCQKRLSTYWATVASDQTFAVNTTGTPPRNMRLWFPYAEETSEVVLVINYFEVNRRYLWLEGVGRLSPATSSPAVGDGQPHGSYVWHQSDGLLRVKLTGAGRVLEVRTEAVLNINAQLAIGFDEFFEDGFIENVAAVLGIDSSRIKVAQVVPGSVVVEVEVSEDPAVLDGPLPELVVDTSRNVDAETQRKMRGDEAAQAEYLQQQSADDEATGSGSTQNETASSQGESTRETMALVDVVARLNETVRSGEFSAALGAELLGMTVTLRSGEQLEDELTFSLEEDEGLSQSSSDTQAVVVITSTAIAAVFLLCAAVLGLFLLRRRRQHATKKSVDRRLSSDDGDIDKSGLQHIDSKHSDTALLDAVASVLGSSERRIRVRGDDNGVDGDFYESDGFEASEEAKAVISDSLTARKGQRGGQDGSSKAKCSPVPLRVDPDGADDPWSLRLDGDNDKSTPLKSPSARSPVGSSSATLKRRVSSKKRVEVSEDDIVAPFDSTRLRQTTVVHPAAAWRQSSDEMRTAADGVVEYFRRSVDDDEWVKELHNLPDPPHSIIADSVSAHVEDATVRRSRQPLDGSSDGDRGGVASLHHPTDRRDSSGIVVDTGSAGQHAFEKCWSSGAFSSVLATAGAAAQPGRRHTSNMDDNDSVEAPSSSPPPRSTVAPTREPHHQPQLSPAHPAPDRYQQYHGHEQQPSHAELHPLRHNALAADRGSLPEGLGATGYIALPLPYSRQQSETTGQRRDARDIQLGTPSDVDYGVGGAPDAVDPPFVQPAYAASLHDAVGDASGLGYPVTDKGVKAASRYTYAKQGETYAGAVVHPRNPAPPRGQQQVPGSFQQSQLYNQRLGAGIPREQQQQRYTETQGSSPRVGFSMATPTVDEQDGGRSGVGGLGEGGVRPGGAMETLDPVALMRGKSLGDAEALSRLLMAELPEDEERGGPSRGSWRSREGSRGADDEARRTSEVVEAAKTAQVQREKEAEAARRLQKLARPQDELDEFADEVLSNKRSAASRDAVE